MMIDTTIADTRLSETRGALAAALAARLQMAMDQALAPLREVQARLGDPGNIELAWHEAGHAVAATLLGLGVQSASIAPPVTFTAPINTATATPGDLERGAVMLLSGAAAGEVRTGVAGWAGCGDDLATAVTAAEALGHRGAAVIDFLSVSYAEAVNLLRANRPALVAVAGRLLARGNLTGDEVAAAMAGAQGGKALDHGAVRRAYHAAGHTITTIAHGLPHEEHVRLHPGADLFLGLRGEQLERAVQSTLSGVLGEGIFMGRSRHLWSEANADMSALQKLLGRAGIGGEAKGPYLQDQSAAAGQVLADRWSDCETIAALILGSASTPTYADALAAIRLSAG